MILRNITFQHDLFFREDHVHTIEIASPALFSRFVMSMLALEKGETPVEPCGFYENEQEVDAEKLLTVISDPFHIELNSRKNLNALYAKLEQFLAMDPGKQADWSKLIFQLNDILEELCQTLHCDVSSLKPEISLSDFCKGTDLRFTEKHNSAPLQRLCSLMDLIAEFMPRRLLVICNIVPYLACPDWFELLKYACYTKINLLVLEQKLPLEMYNHEIRWRIDSDYNDEICFS